MTAKRLKFVAVAILPFVIVFLVCVVVSLRRCVVASLRRCVVVSLRRCVVVSLRRCVGVSFVVRRSPFVVASFASFASSLGSVCLPTRKTYRLL